MAATKFGALSLGTREDAATWVSKCGSIGLTPSVDVRKPNPILKEAKDFFASSPDWIYLGGHFSDNRLYNENDSFSATFEPAQVAVKTGEQTETLGKADRKFVTL